MTEKSEEATEPAEPTAQAGAECSDLLAKHDEYKQVCALLCIWIDTSVKAAEGSDDALEFLRRLKGNKDLITTDVEARESMYSGQERLFSLTR